MRPRSWFDPILLIAAFMLLAGVALGIMIAGWLAR